MNVSAHAARRYCERVNPTLSPIQAIAAIQAHDAAVSAAIRFRAPVVKLGNGARLVIQDDTVVTVLGRGMVAPR